MSYCRTNNVQVGRLLKFLQLLESCQYNILACLFDLSCQEDLIQDSIYLANVHAMQSNQ